MARLKIPYPPSPTDVPDDLTDFPESYIRQQSLLLAGLFVFLIFYVGLVILFAMLGVWCLLTWEAYPALKLIGLVLCVTFFLYLVKGFFKSHPMNQELHIEITEDEHPVLFGFIHKLCDELGAPEPNRVYVSPDVNAAVIPRTTLANLFVEPKKDLLIGLGLVNCLNLSEFKSVLAHEFGHFSQSAMAGSYAYVTHRIITDLIEGEDWFDRMITWCKRQENALKLFGYGVGGCLWLGRKVLWWLFRAITLQRLAVMRESEFHADLLAVKAAGSDAVALSLFRMRFGNLCLNQAIDDLVPPARDHKLYSRDIFLHQDRAAPVVRRKRKDPNLGIPPVHDHPLAGQKIRIFDPDDEDPYDDIPEMRRTHPPAHELEANAKATFIPAVVDHRSPWILFTNPAELREAMSYKFYRVVFNIPKGSELTDAQKVQEYIDNEHAETTYDPKYHGAYDDRPLEPGDLNELHALIKTSPWTDERIDKTLENLYDGCREHAEAHADLHKELQSLQGSITGKPSKKMSKRISDVEKQIDENWEWFKSFDRRVYLLFVQMAERVAPQLRNELVERYRFQLEVQRLYQEARSNFNKADAYITAYGAAMRGEIQVPNDFGAEVISVLRETWRALKKIVQDAREINLPAMKNFEEGERLADFILDGKLVSEPPLSELKGKWVEKLMNQLHGVKNRCFRLHFKSVGGILALQEKIADAWRASRIPVSAEVAELLDGQAEGGNGAVAVAVEPGSEPAGDPKPKEAPREVADVAVESFIEAAANTEAVTSPQQDSVGGFDVIEVTEVTEVSEVTEVTDGFEAPPSGGGADRAEPADTRAVAGPGPDPLAAEPPTPLAFDVSPTPEVPATPSPARPGRHREEQAATEIINLDASASVEPEPKFTLDVAGPLAAKAPAAPKPTAATRSGPAATTGPAAGPTPVPRRSGGRPRVKITFVRPGEKSPL